MSKLSDKKFYNALADLLSGTPDEKRAAYWTLLNDRIPAGRADMLGQALDSVATRITRANERP